MPGKAPPLKSRPGGYAVISIGVRTDSIGCYLAAIKRFQMLCYFAPKIQFFPGKPGISRRFRKRSKTRHTFRRKIPLGLGAHRSYRTLRDGSLGWRCPRHFVPGRLRRLRRARQAKGLRDTFYGRDVGFAESGYDRTVPPGHFATDTSTIPHLHRGLPPTQKPGAPRRASLSLPPI